jgi:hypothetical protein
MGETEFKTPSQLEAHAQEEDEHSATADPDISIDNDRTLGQQQTSYNILPKDC